MEDNGISATDADGPAPAAPALGPAQELIGADIRTSTPTEPSKSFPSQPTGSFGSPGSFESPGSPGSPGATGPTALAGVELGGADFAAAVDALSELEATPVHTHAARYSDVHSLLQDALSDTDRGGANPR
jgi:hypothetical protein